MSNREVGALINEKFVAYVEQVGDFSTKNVNGRIQKNGGNVATYFCLPNGRVVNGVLGPVNADVLLTEARWSLDAIAPVRDKALHFQKYELQKVHRARAGKSPSRGWGDKRDRMEKFLADHPLDYLDVIYQEVFKDILGEKLSTAGLTIAQAADQIETAKATGRPLLFVIHDQSESQFKKKWQAMTNESHSFDRNMRKQLADYVVVTVRENQQAALSQKTNRPPFESPSGRWPLFVVANSEGEQLDSVSGSWSSRALAEALATNWIDAIGERQLSPRQVKLARVVHDRIETAPQEKYDLLELEMIDRKLSKRE